MNILNKQEANGTGIPYRLQCNYRLHRWQTSGQFDGEKNVIVNEAFNISPVVKIETLGFNGDKSDLKKLENLLSFATIFYIDDSVIQKTIELKKMYKIKLGDSIIAATALVHNITLLTRNLNDFKNIEGLKVINPHVL